MVAPWLALLGQISLCHVPQHFLCQGRCFSGSDAVPLQPMLADSISYNVLHNLFLTKIFSYKEVILIFPHHKVLNSSDSNYGPGNADSVKSLPYCPAPRSHTGKQQEAQALAWEARSYAPICQFCMLKNRV